MAADDRLTDLLTSWQEAYEQGQDLPVAELCRDHPELADALRRAIAFQKKMGRLADQAAALTPPRACHWQLAASATRPTPRPG